MPQLGDLLARVALGETLGQGEAETLRLEFNNLQSIGAIARKWAAPNGELDLSFLPINTIYSTTLSVDTASVTVPIGSIYRHLMILCNGRTTNATASDGLRFRCNGDTGANYSLDGIQSVDGTHGSATAAAETGAPIATVPGASSDANYSLGGTCIISNIQSALYKAYISHAGGAFKTSVPLNEYSMVIVYGGLWRSTARISTITIYAVSEANMLAGTSIAVVGIV